jgi:aminotransferase
VAGAVGFKGLTEPHGMGVMQEWRDEFDRRRKFFCKRMDEIEGISCHTFEGAFYAFPDVSSFGVPMQKFVEDLLKKENVQVDNAERHGDVKNIGSESLAYGHIRPALVQDMEVLEEAANRIERFVKTL